MQVGEAQYGKIWYWHGFRASKVRVLIKVLGCSYSNLWHANCHAKNSTVPPFKHSHMVMQNKSIID